MDALWQFGWHWAACFMDDNFIGNKRVPKEGLLPALIEWQKGNRDTLLFTEAPIDLADFEELMRMMVEAGFNQVFVGIGTPEEASLAECNERQNRGRDWLPA